MSARLKMMMGAGLLVTTVAACAPDDTANDVGIPQDTAPATPGAQTMGDPQILHIVMLANTADSSGGELAQQRGTNAAVKAFGQRMIADHGGANQQLRTLAQGGTMTPQDNPTSQQLQTQHQQTTQMLQGQSGAAFDRAYIDHEVQLHQMILQQLDQQLIPSAQDAQLRSQLEGIRSVVQSHLQQAQQIQGQLGQSGQDTTAQDTAAPTGP